MKCTRYIYLNKLLNRMRFIFNIVNAARLYKRTGDRMLRQEANVMAIKRRLDDIFDGYLARVMSEQDTICMKIPN